MQAQTISFNTNDGLTLRADRWGDPTAPAVIFSHGGGQTRHAWGGTAEALAREGWYSIAYDHRGHGDSDWSPEHAYGLGDFAADMHGVARDFSQPPAVVGASLGGLSAMLSAGELQPGLFSSVVLVDVTPSLNRAGVNRIYEFMSSHIESGFESLEQAAELIAGYTGRPVRKDVSGLKKNLRQRGDRWYWHWDPGFFQLRDDAQSTPHRARDALAAIDVPILLIRGGMSDVVTEEQVEEFRSLAPHAEYVDVAAARHMVAGDRNDVFTSAVSDFLQRHRPA